MDKRGRPSAGDLAAKARVATVVAGDFGRAAPPEGMAEDQAVIWRQIVATEPVEFFATAATKGLLPGLLPASVDHRQAVGDHRAVPGGLAEGEGRGQAVRRSLQGAGCRGAGGGGQGGEAPAHQPEPVDAGEKRDRGAARVEARNEAMGDLRRFPRPHRVRFRCYGG